MYACCAWLNDYLDPPASADEQATLLTRAGFPLEGREEVVVGDGTDWRQDFEMTSNRGDCVSHVGLAREIAAISGRAFEPPTATPPTTATRADSITSVVNEEQELCPLYTARIIRGVTIGPSPDWLAQRLIARGDVPRNNVVDATNFVLHELGQPTHIFDLATLEEQRIVVRRAREGETFLPIGEGEAEISLTTNDLVIADARVPVALAGVKGGALTAVGDATTDLLLEAATFDPVAVRAMSRRHGISSDSGYRFERGVHPGQVNAAADRLAALVLEIAGGELCDGVVSDGAPIPERRRATMRTDRCRQILGVPVSDEQMLEFLSRLGFEPTPAAPPRAGEIDCIVPVFRLDVEREIDLIEEVGRMYGHDKIPIDETIRIRVAPPQATSLARRAVANELAAMGFVEAVTHSLVDDDAAEAFLPAGATALRIDDHRAGGEPALQPSVMPGLLRVRRLNLNNGVEHLRLFEHAATFWNMPDGHREVIRLGLLMDVEGDDDGLRPIRGVVQRLVEVLLGRDARVEVEPCTEVAWLAPAVRASVDGTPIGVFGLVATAARDRFALDQPLLAAELDVAQFHERFPPVAEARALPTFPAIERDLSPIVGDGVTWGQVSETIAGLDLDRLEAAEFITTFRGKSVPEGHKALTLRLRFRAPDRTLVHDEVDPQVARVVEALETSLQATFRRGTGSS